LRIYYINILTGEKLMGKIALVFIIIVLFFSCSSPDRKTHVVIVFDVEDYITPETEGIDDIPKWLAEIMTDEGVTGTFFMICEKARSLEKRGRRDVIAAIAQHDIGSHTNFGSIHPTVTEQLEKAEWNAGVQKMLEQESAGFRDLERIFETKVTTLARHGGSYGPQLVHALGKMNAGYVYSPVHLPGKNAVWFCNTLNFHGEIGGFDNFYYRDDLFDPVLDSLKINFPRLTQNLDVVTFFACHPCKIRTEQFWDLNFYYGAHTDSSEWKSPELRPLESMKTAQKNFRRMMQFLKNQDNIEITTFQTVMELYSKQKEFITKKDLKRIAEKCLNENTLIIDDYFSAAEVFAGLVKSINEYQNSGTLPNEIQRNSPLGPMEMPDTEPEISMVSIDQVYQLIREALNHINQNGVLPASLTVEGFKIGTGSLFALFSAVILDIISENFASEYTVPSFEPYPKANEKAIIEEVEGYKTWPVHRNDLDMGQLVEFTRLQLWTLKPAHIM